MSRGQSLTSVLRRGSVLGFVLMGGGTAAMMLMHLAVARASTRAEYGVFSHGLAIVAVLALGSSLGWPGALLRFVPEQLAAQRFDLLRSVLALSHRATAMASIAMALVLVGLSRHPWCSTELSASLVFAAVMLPLQALERVRQAALRGLHALTGALLPVGLVMPLVVATVVWWLAPAASAVRILYVACLAATLLIGFVWLWVLVPRQAVENSEGADTGRWLRVAFVVLGGNLAAVALQRTPAILLGMLGSFEQVASFSLANRIALLLVFALNAINLIATPMIARAYHTGDRAAARLLFRQAARWSALAAIPPFVVMMWLADPLLGLAGAGYRASASVMRVLSVGWAFAAAVGPVSVTLSVCGRERLFAVSTMTVAVVHVAGCAVVLAPYGALGVAVVTMISAIALKLWHFVAVRRLLTD